MFPKDEIEVLKDEIQAATYQESEAIGRSFKYDYKIKRYIAQDGKIKEVRHTEAIKQWIELMLRTPDKRYPIYEGTEFGVNLDKYIGFKKSNLGYVQSELKREISEKIVQNRAIIGIEDFEVIEADGRMVINFVAILRSGESLVVNEIV